MLALFWGLLFLGTQAVSVAHLHTDEGADSTCVVCTLVKSDTAATDSQAVQPAAAVRHPASPAVGPRIRTDFTRSAFEARAPPLA